MSQLTSTPVGYMVIGVGSFVFLLSFLGLCGARLESRSLLRIYAIVLFVIAAVAVVCAGTRSPVPCSAGGSHPTSPHSPATCPIHRTPKSAALAFSYRSETEELLADAWNSTDPTIISTIQEQEHCCGWASLADGVDCPTQAVAAPPLDSLLLATTTPPTTTAPTTAEPTTTTTTTTVAPDGTTTTTTAAPTTTAGTTGAPEPGLVPCKEKLITLFDKYLVVVAVVGIVAVVLLLVGLLCACCLSCYIPSEAKKAKRLLAAAEKLNRDGWEAEDRRRSRNYGATA